MQQPNSCASSFRVLFDQVFGVSSKVIKQVLSLLLCAGLLCLSSVGQAEYLSINFSKKNQVKTVLVWIQHKPELAGKPRQSRRARAPKHQFHRNPNFSEVSVSAAPYLQVGKLFFKSGDSSGQVSSCTAAFAGGRQVLVTAAHCVMTQGGNWNRDFIFIRGFGSQEQEVYAVQCVGIPAEWGDLIGDEMLRADYAFLRTSRASEFGRLDLPKIQAPPAVRIVGYSDNYRDGAKMLELKSLLEVDGDRLVSLRNPLGTGNSGSPWLNQAGNQLVSVSSFLDLKVKNRMSGPKLSSDLLPLVAYVNNECRPL